MSIFEWVRAIESIGRDIRSSVRFPKQVLRRSWVLGQEHK